MSLEEGSAYNEKLIPISRGDVLPDRSVPVEYITYDLWESMRAHDREMADEIMEPVFVFMRAQTDKARMKRMSLGEYFVYRERDVGKAYDKFQNQIGFYFTKGKRGSKRNQANPDWNRFCSRLLSALMRFSMGLKITPAELEVVRPVDMNCSRHLSVINDIYSYEKELFSSQTAHAEGGALCTSVQIIMQDGDFTIEAAKRILFFMCREWESTHRRLVNLIQDNRAQTPAIRAYVDGLEYQMSGNELWSKTTLRYSEVSE